MRNIVISLLLAPVFFAFECGKKCDTYTQKKLMGKAEDYFGVYKDGNWWLYKNQSGALTDSVYLIAYSDVFNRDKSACTENQQRKFTLGNAYLVNGNPLYVIYEATGSSIGINFSLNTGLTQSAGFPQFIYFLNENFISSYPLPGYNGSNLLDSIRLNSINYYNILFATEGSSTYYFGKDRGLVGWGNALDTFNLIKFKIL